MVEKARNRNGHPDIEPAKVVLNEETLESDLASKRAVQGIVTELAYGLAHLDILRDQVDPDDEVSHFQDELDVVTKEINNIKLNIQLDALRLKKLYEQIRETKKALTLLEEEAETIAVKHIVCLSKN